MDIRQAFARYTEGTLTLSAGIGLYQPKFPIHVSAAEVAGLEDDSKKRPGKDALTFLPDGVRHEEWSDEEGEGCSVNDATYSWQTFMDEVIGEKYRLISGFFSLRKIGEEFPLPSAGAGA